MHHPRIVTTIAELREALAASGSVGLVPTMGALHDGHLAHVARARELVDTVVVSIFVNPLQFGPNEDYLRYPRDLEADAAKLADADLIFAPEPAEMYPNGAIETRITAGRVGDTFEGRSRPGHFDGVLTVVAKLLNIVGPRVVTFGEKDAQQAFLVERMIRDLDIPTRVELIPIVREDDDLAMSSRNRYLSDRERVAARALSRALEAAESSADRGIDAVIAASQSVVMGEPLVELDYFAIVDPATFQPVDDGYRGPARAIIAARVGSTRLIDNTRLRLG
ncbi:pantoate--beta-alanine ligase [Galbitalea sp. SE-J8]|uniref:pantoate--beta-alanine ligase n=1 Tax=Galbitalea sp. SE-J8 TaxID=3054952 RepID=UPI00259CD946|nr:pantoate--beta-alanine ligase [Galbitalea sp. SE-J8]MDM4761643.1 pantoate--beta-alanine ligase [Galbitalea sp. SE-J8]